MNKPNLFIVGVARSGTSAWFEALGQHPEVFVPVEQRPNYFGDFNDECGKYFITEKRYLWLFKRAKKEKIIVDASHIFSYEDAPHFVKKFNPKSKIIVLLRNAVDVLLSVCRANKGLDYDTLLFTMRELEYSKNLKRWKKVFGKNLHVIIFEEYVKNPLKEYKKVCKFLGIDNNFKPDFLERNPS